MAEAKTAGDGGEEDLVAALDAQATVAALEDGELLVGGADAQERGECAALGEPALAAEALVELAPADELAVEPNAGATRAVEKSRATGRSSGKRLRRKAKAAGRLTSLYMLQMSSEMVWLDGHRWCHHSTVRKALAVPLAAKQLLATNGGGVRAMERARSAAMTRAL